MACTMAIQTVRPSATSKPRRVVKRRPSLSGAHRNGLSNSLRNSIGNSTYSLGGSTHSSSDYDASDSSGFPTVDDILMDEFEREGEGTRRSSPPPPPRPSRPLRRLPMGNHEQPQSQSQPQPQMPRRRSSMDSIDASPRLQQRRRSSLDGISSSMSSAGGMASLRHGGGGNPIFRPPTLDHASQEPLDAALGGGSQHSLGGIPAGSAAVDSGGSAPSRSALAIRRTSMSDLEQAERRASIKQIMRDGRLSQLEKRRSIQCLMDGRSHNNARRSTIDCGQTNPYLQAKLAAEVRRREETIRRSSSFDNGRPEDGNPPPIEEGEDESMASLGRRESVASSVASLSRRGSAAESVDALSRRGTMESVVSLASARRESVASQHTFASAGGGEAAATSGTDLPMEDPPSFGSAPTSVFAAFNAGFTPPSLPDGGGTSEVPAPSDGSAAPWASFHGRSMNDSEHDRGLFAAAAATSVARSDRRREEGDDDGDGDGGGDDDDLGEYVHVPDHTPQVAAAIARATAETLTERLAAKHPYSATTTAVPAVAAGASEAYGAGMKGGEGRAAQRRTSSVDVCRRAIATAPPCTHYQRNCHIVSPCCGATFGCRICHDDCPVLPPPLDWVPGGGMMDGVMADDAGGGGNGGRRYQRVQRTSSMPSSFSPSMGPPEHHNVDRFAIKEIICRECFTKQSSKSNFCVNCNVQFGEYHCAICNLWMSNEERPYHCPDCGFCRVGGGENFRHCKDCGMCIDKQLFADHNCKVGKYMSNCPVCQEDLFSSRDASHELPCGHAIHWHCFRELASHDSRCPMCKKTAETHERMKPTWDAMAMGIALQPVPPELSKVVTIKCNDCERVQEKRSWHFLGVQCRHCESFNTVVERITMIGQEAHEFLLRNNENGEDVGALTVGEQRRQEQAAQSQGSSGGGPGATQHAAANARATNGTPRARRRRRASMMAVPPSSGSTSATPPPPFG